MLIVPVIPMFPVMSYNVSCVMLQFPVMPLLPVLAVFLVMTIFPLMAVFPVMPAFPVMQCFGSYLVLQAPIIC